MKIMVIDSQGDRITQTYRDLLPGLTVRGADPTHLHAYMTAAQPYIRRLIERAEGGAQ